MSEMASLSLEIHSKNEFLQIFKRLHLNDWTFRMEDGLVHFRPEGDIDNFQCSAENLDEKAVYDLLNRKFDLFEDIDVLIQSLEKGAITHLCYFHRQKELCFLPMADDNLQKSEDFDWFVRSIRKATEGIADDRKLVTAFTQSDGSYRFYRED